MVSTANIFCNRDLHSWGTLAAGVCLGMPNSTEMLISLVSSFPPGCRAELDFLVQVVLPGFSFFR